MKPWEKVCPECAETQKLVARIGAEDLVPGPLEGCQCHGTGVVPMTTAEMLEALARHFSDGYWCLECDCGVCWRVAVLSGDEPRGVPETVWHDTPDDAMRAALEAVQPTKEATDGE